MVMITDAKASAKRRLAFHWNTLFRSTRWGFIRYCGKSSKKFRSLSDHSRAANDDVHVWTFMLR